jgi:glycosyltransferase involved in cell wall biosynthesis
MRILLVAARYYPHHGGIETVVHHLAEEFQRLGHHVLIVTNRYPRTLSVHEVIDGVPVLRMQFLYPQMRFLKEKRLDLLAAGFWFGLFTTWRLRRAMREFKPDVVNLHYLGAPAFFLSILKAFTRFPLVVSLHGGDVDGEPHLNNQRMRLFQRATRQADIVTACSQDLGMQAIALSPALEKLRVIHNGVDVELFAKARSYGHPKPYVAAVGQLVEHKGFDLLINAFADVAATRPDVDLLIAGEGDSRKKLTALIKERDVVGRVHLLGRVNEDKVASLMAGSVFVAVPSRREPFGIVALEGMAAGKTVLASAVGGITEFLPNGINRHIAPERKAWVDALDDLLSKHSSGQLDGESNRAVARKFQWESVAERYLEAYADARASFQKR